MQQYGMRPQNTIAASADQLQRLTQDFQRSVQAINAAHQDVTNQLDQGVTTTNRDLQQISERADQMLVQWRDLAGDRAGAPEWQELKRQLESVREPLSVRPGQALEMAANQQKMWANFREEPSNLLRQLDAQVPHIQNPYEADDVARRLQRVRDQIGEYAHQAGRDSHELNGCWRHYQQHAKEAIQDRQQTLDKVAQEMPKLAERGELDRLAERDRMVANLSARLQSVHAQFANPGPSLKEDLSDLRNLGDETAHKLEQMGMHEAANEVRDYMKQYMQEARQFLDRAEQSVER